MEHGVRRHSPGMGEKRGLKGSSAIDLSHRANGAGKMIRRVA
jgi:hypothetical protein